MKILIPLILLAACTKEKVSFDTVEDARRQARENAQMIATDWRRQNPATAELDIYMRGDSTIAPDCPQGDGWASVDLRSRDGAKAVKLKCSTVSLSLSCLEEADFKTKAYASEEGRCNKDLPFPLPKLVK